MVKQRGAALIIAMMVVALAATIAVAISGEHLLQMRRAQNHQVLEQGKQLLLGAEQLAMLALFTDSQGDSEIDGGQDIWAQPPQRYPVDGGWMLGGIEDLQGRFNINSLLIGLRNGDTDNVAVPYTVPQQRFVKLLLSLPELRMSREDAIALTEGVIDWLDSNQRPTGFGGKEDDYYMGEGLSYRTADRAMVSTSELRAVGGVSDELYQLLAPHIAALPVYDTALNVNMLTPVILASLRPGDEPLPLATAREWVEELRKQPLNDIQMFVGDARWESPIPVEGLELKSSFFLFGGQVKLGDSVLEMESMLYRQNGKARVVQRALGTL
jgi:general secretion pathway protein K